MPGSGSQGRVPGGRCGIKTYGKYAMSPLTSAHTQFWPPAAKLRIACLNSSTLRARPRSIRKRESSVTSWPVQRKLMPVAASPSTSSFRSGSGTIGPWRGTISITIVRGSPRFTGICSSTRSTGTWRPWNSTVRGEAG